jgi:hypothetical protein
MPGIHRAFNAPIAQGKSGLGPRNRRLTALDPPASRLFAVRLPARFGCEFVGTGKSGRENLSRSAGRPGRGWTVGLIARCQMAEAELMIATLIHRVRKAASMQVRVLEQIGSQGACCASLGPERNSFQWARATA